MKHTNRRKFLKTSLGISAATVASTALGINPLNAFVSCSSPSSGGGKGTGDILVFEQEPLPYEFDALEPYIDARTMEIHYSRHHKAYVDNANAAITEENIPYTTVEDLFANISKLSAKARNNAGGAWNHSFFWKTMRAPVENNQPGEELLNALNAAFGSFEEFKTQFAAAGTGRFGSGWAWLIDDNGTLKIGSTPNQDNPLMDVSGIKGRPLLGIDVWEH